MNVVEHTIECSGSAEGIAVLHAVDELNAPMQVAHVRPGPRRDAGVVLLMTVPYTNHLVYSNVLAKLRAILQKHEVSDDVVNQVFPGRGRICSDHEAEEKYQQFFSPSRAAAAAEPMQEFKGSGLLYIPGTYRPGEKMRALRAGLEAAGLPLMETRLVSERGRYLRDHNLDVVINFDSKASLLLKTKAAVKIVNTVLKLKPALEVTSDLLREIIESAERRRTRVIGSAEPRNDTRLVRAWSFDNRCDVGEAVLQSIFDAVHAKLPDPVRDNLFLTYVSGNNVIIYTAVEGLADATRLVFTYLSACFKSYPRLHLERTLRNGVVAQITDVESLRTWLPKIAAGIPSRRERIKRAEAAAEPHAPGQLPPMRFILNMYCEPGSHEPERFRAAVLDLLHKHKIYPEETTLELSDERNLDGNWVVHVINPTVRGAQSEAALLERIAHMLGDLYKERAKFELDFMKPADFRELLDSFKAAIRRSYTVTVGAAEPKEGPVDISSVGAADLDALTTVIKAVNAKVKHVKLFGEELDTRFYDLPSILHDRGTDKFSLSITLGVFTNEYHFQIAEFDIESPEHGKAPKVSIENSDIEDRLLHGLGGRILPVFPHSKLPKLPVMNMQDMRTFALSLSKWLKEVAEVYRAHLQTYADSRSANPEL